MNDCENLQVKPRTCLLPVRNVLQHQSKSCIFSRFHLFQINYKPGVVHVLLRFLARKYSGIDRLEDYNPVFNTYRVDIVGISWLF